MFKKLFPIIFFLICSMAVFFYTKTALWIPLLIFAIFISLNKFVIQPSVSKDRLILDELKKKYADYNPPLGVIAQQQFEDFEFYGMFIKLDSKLVCIDIKEDKLLDQRMKIAYQIFEQAETLNQKLLKLKIQSKKYQNRSVACFGLHSKDLARIEVFWQPDGYSSMVDFEFLDDIGEISDPSYKLE